MTRAAFDEFLRAFHRPAHGRRTADRAAAFLLPHLRPGMALLDIGCGPASITEGLAAAAGWSVGVDLSPGPAGVALATADAARLPFPDASFDALFSHAVLQHVPDPVPLLREARRVARDGAVIGLADADWGGAVFEPPDPMVLRGQAIREELRAGGDVYVGRRLGGLLHEAGFALVETRCRAVGALTPEAAEASATSEARFFEAEPVVAHLTAEGRSTPNECRAIAAAWRRWGATPGALRVGYWFEAVGRAQTG